MNRSSGYATGFGPRRTWFITDIVRLTASKLVHLGTVRLSRPLTQFIKPVSKSHGFIIHGHPSRIAYRSSDIRFVYRTSLHRAPAACDRLTYDYNSSHSLPSARLSLGDFGFNRNVSTSLDRLSSSLNLKGRPASTRAKSGSLDDVIDRKLINHIH